MTRSITSAVMLLIIALAVILLTGCTSTQPTPPTHYHLPANLSAPCDPLPELHDGQQQTMAAWIITAAGLYHDCSDRHTATVRAVSGDTK